jgi:hypothetical protein
MLAEKKTATNIGVGLGIILHLGGQILAYQGMVTVGWSLTIVGLILFIWGCWNYAQGKGYPGVLGLLGLLSCLGLLILVLLPDKTR